MLATVLSATMKSTAAVASLQRQLGQQSEANDRLSEAMKKKGAELDKAQLKAGQREEEARTLTLKAVDLQRQLGQQREVNDRLSEVVKKQETELDKTQLKADQREGEVRTLTLKNSTLKKRVQDLEKEQHTLRKDCFALMRKVNLYETATMEQADAQGTERSDSIA